MSGSLWFPGFKEYVFSHEPKRWADCIYFSLGDREAKTRNPVLKTVQENTEAIHAHFLAQGIDTAFGEGMALVERKAKRIGGLWERHGVPTESRQPLRPGDRAHRGRYPVVAGQVGDGFRPLFFV